MLIMQCASDESLVPRYRRQDDSVFAPLQQDNNEGKSLIIRERNNNLKRAVHEVFPSKTTTTQQNGEWMLGTSFSRN